MICVPLNMFQRLVRTWEVAHPYNAAQVLKLAGHADAVAINHAWHAALAGMGLGCIHADARNFHYETLNGEAGRYPVQILPPGTCLDSHLSRSLNLPFNDPKEPPFRPFLIENPQAYYFGVVYQHWVADSISIRLLLKEWWSQISHSNQAEARAARHIQSGYWDLFGPRKKRLHLDQAVLGLFRAHMRFRTVRKTYSAGPADLPVRVTVQELPLGFAETLRKASRAIGVTVGDCLLAALAVACHQHVPLQRRSSRRDVAVGNIVDLRPYAGRDLSDAFGFFLGFTHVTCRKSDLHDIPRVVQSIKMQNKACQHQGVAQHTLASLVAGHIAARLGKPANAYRLYRKEIPLAAGLSNVNLAGSWPEPLYPSPLLEYVRVSPTGPMAPLVLSTTTLGPRMSLAYTYRSALLSQQEVRELGQTIIDVLTSITELSCGLSK